MDLATVLRGLHASEIGCGMQMSCESGIEVWVGDSLSGCRVNRSFGIGEMEDAAAWLDERARALYPESDYAKARRV